MINHKLPVCTIQKHPVRIIDTDDQGFSLIGVLKKDSKLKLTRWDESGNCIDGNPDHKIQNKPGLRLVTVHLTVYDDDTTGYGYPRRELAEKYARQDNHALPIAFRQVDLVLPETPNQGKA